MRPVVDSSYERPSSPLLGFNSPMQGRRRMMHAKSCEIMPLRMRMRMQQEEDEESNSSDESWNVASVELKQEHENSSCQVCMEILYGGPFLVLLVVDSLPSPTAITTNMLLSGIQ